MERQSRLSETVHTPSRWNPLHEPLPTERGDRSMYRRTMEEVSGLIFWCGLSSGQCIHMYLQLTFILRHSFSFYFCLHSFSFLLLPSPSFLSGIKIMLSRTRHWQQFQQCWQRWWWCSVALRFASRVDIDNRKKKRETKRGEKKKKKRQEKVWIF